MAAGACVGPPRALRDLSGHLVVEGELAVQVGLVPDTLDVPSTPGVCLVLIDVAKFELEFRVTLPGQPLQAVALDVLRIGKADRPQPLGGEPLVDLVQMVADQLLLPIGDLALVWLAGVLACRIIEAFSA